VKLNWHNNDLNFTPFRLEVKCDHEIEEEHVLKTGIFYFHVNGTAKCLVLNVRLKCEDGKFFVYNNYVKFYLFTSC
jgi:hypothetical protein